MLRISPMMEQLVAKLENDVRNELHFLMAMLQLVAEDPVTQAQEDYLAACRYSSDRVLRSVQNLSEFAGPQIGEPQISEFDLEQTVAGVAGIMEVLAQRKGLTFVCEVHPGASKRVAGDRGAIEDILFRLLDNAIRFTEQGSVRFTTTVTPVDSQTLRVEFSVRDTGPGIPHKIAGRPSGPGQDDLAVLLGLGLPVVHKFVLRLGGYLSIDPGEGNGSHVSVSLPLRAVAASQVTHTGRLERADEQAGELPFGILVAAELPFGILVAEDSDDNYFVVETYLRDLNHPITRARDGAKAVEIFKTGHFGLVLMDVHMPGINGYAATQAIREWETGHARARTPIVVLSSDSPGTQIRSGARVGCSGYLTKPVSKEALLNTIKRYALTDVPL